MIRDPGDLIGISEQFKVGYLAKSRDIKRLVISKITLVDNFTTVFIKTTVLDLYNDSGSEQE